MLKKIKNFFHVGKSTYFHDSHGIVVRKNKFHARILRTSSLASFAGAVFVLTHFAIPALKSSQLFQSTQTLSPNAVVSAEPNPLDKLLPPITQEDESLKKMIQDKLATYPANQKWSVYMYDLKYDRSVKVNVNEVYAAASLYKLFLLEALENKLPYDQWWWTYVGDKTVGACVEAMLQSEDDPCAEELGQLIGWDKADKINHENGYKKTQLSGFKGKLTTPSDVGELFVRMKKGQMLSDNARRFVFDALYQQTQSKGISKGCGKCRTADKIGELSKIAHDAGVVTHGQHSYVLVIMSEGGTFKQITEITKFIEEELAD